MRKDVEKTGNDDHENTPRTSNADGFFTENNVLSGKRCLHILFLQQMSCFMQSTKLLYV